jgi:hypothetical protein
MKSFHSFMAILTPTRHKVIVSLATESVGIPLRGLGLDAALPRCLRLVRLAGVGSVVKQWLRFDSLGMSSVQMVVILLHHNAVASFRHISLDFRI